MKSMQIELLGFYLTCWLLNDAFKFVYGIEDSMLRSESPN